MTFYLLTINLPLVQKLTPYIVFFIILKIKDFFGYKKQNERKKKKKRKW